MPKKRVYSLADKKRMANSQAKKRAIMKKKKIAAAKIEVASNYVQNKTNIRNIEKAVDKRNM